MEEPVLTMDVTRLRAEPGGQAQVSVKVKNPGHLVEAFHMDVVGLDPTWWQVHPPELNIYPGKEESAVVMTQAAGERAARRTRRCRSASGRSPRWTRSGPSSRRVTSRSAGCSTCRGRSPP